MNPTDKLIALTKSTAKYGENIMHLSERGKASVAKSNHALSLMDTRKQSLSRLSLISEIIEEELNDVGECLAEAVELKQVYEGLLTEALAVPYGNYDVPVTQEDLIDTLEEGLRTIRDLSFQFRSVEIQLKETSQEL